MFSMVKSFCLEVYTSRSSCWKHKYSNIYVICDLRLYDVEEDWNGIVHSSDTGCVYNIMARIEIVENMSLYMRCITGEFARCVKYFTVVIELQRSE